MFVVDNGPAEQPCSPLVQMCLSRLLNLLKLDKICQTSFAEYHSKRNFVERAHAVENLVSSPDHTWSGDETKENRVLSRYGPFSSTMVHQIKPPGSKEHVENMECVASEVVKCI